MDIPDFRTSRLISHEVRMAFGDDDDDRTLR
jgi:hypothetical protein